MTDEGVSPVPREAQPYQGRRAGLVTRLIAGIVDGLVVIAVLATGYLTLNALLFLVDPRGFQFARASQVISVTTAFVVVVSYLSAAWTITGRTYGCHVMGLRVVGRQDRRLRLPVAVLRAVLCALFPIGLLLCAGGRGRRSLQDLLLRTSVIYDWRAGPPGGDGDDHPLGMRTSRHPGDDA